MPKNTYDIQELVTQSGVPRRTVYFYVQQGVLPPPEGAGLAAHYSEGHLLRLRLIPLLRQQGLRLDEIRERFTQLAEEEMRRMLNTSRPASAPAPGPLRAVREPFAPEIPVTPPGWGQQRFTHYALPAGIALVAPENLSMADRQRLNQLLQAARQIFSGSAVVFIQTGQVPAANEADDNPSPGDRKSPGDGKSPGDKKSPDERHI